MRPELDAGPGLLQELPVRRRGNTAPNPSDADLARLQPLPPPKQRKTELEPNHPTRGNEIRFALKRVDLPRLQIYLEINAAPEQGRTYDGRPSITSHLK